MPAKRLISERQREVLFGFMQKHPTLAKGICESPLARRETNGQWAELAARLNNAARDGTGCTKTANQWRFYWNNAKCKVRKKEVIRRAQARASSDGSLPKKLHSLSDEEEKLLAILGRIQQPRVTTVQAGPNYLTTSCDEEESYQESQTSHTPLIQDDLTESRIHPNTNNKDSGKECLHYTPLIQQEFTESGIPPNTKNINNDEEPQQYTPSIKEELTESRIHPNMKNIDNGEEPLQHTPSIQEELTVSRIHPITIYLDSIEEPPQQSPSIKEELTESRMHTNTNSIDTGEQPLQYTPSIQDEKPKSIFVPNKNSMDSSETSMQTKEEEWAIFGKAVGIQMRNLDETQLAITQKIMSDTIYYAKFGMLTQKSHLKL